jgi:hypothetical protein
MSRGSSRHSVLKVRRAAPETRDPPSLVMPEASSGGPLDGGQIFLAFHEEVGGTPLSHHVETEVLEVLEGHQVPPKHPPGSVS